MFRPPLFTPSDRRALTVLTVVLALIVGGVWWWTSYRRGARPQAVPIDSTEQVNRFWTDVDRRQKLRAAKYHRAPRLFAFDPNSADSATLAALGLPRHIAGRICRYRKAGGRFRHTEDLLKIYGMSKTDYLRLKPYVRIGSLLSERRATKPVADTPYHHPVIKFKHPVKVDANKADSLTLIRIPGIGPYYARRIKRYGELLGGYVDVAQLKEINGFPDDALQWFKVESAEIRKINVNTASFKELLRHPYLNYEQVKAIMNHRRKAGALRSLQELSNNEAFTAADLRRLSPYAAF